MTIITLSSKSQLVLPAKLRRRFGLGRGDKLTIEEKNGAIVIRPVVKLSKLMGVDKGSGSALLEDLKAMRGEWDEELESMLKTKKHTRRTTG